MLVSVVIPCRNGDPVVMRQLQALVEQRVDAEWEIVVADNGSTDQTASMVRAFSSLNPRVRLVDASSAPGINVARNAGISASYGEFILLCDSDDLVGEEWLAAYIEAFDGGAHLVGGSQIELFGGHVVRESGLLDELGYLPWALGANCGFSRRVVERIGLFDENYRGGGDETDYFWRAQLAGFSLVEVPDARIHYAQRDRAVDVLRQHVRFGRSHVQLYRAYASRGMPQELELRHVLGGVRALVVMAVARQPARRVRASRRAGIVFGRMLESLRPGPAYI